VVTSRGDTPASADTGEEDPPPDSSTSRVLLIAFGAVAVLMLATAFFFVRRSGTDEPSSNDYSPADLTIDERVMIAIRAVDPDATAQHSEREWLDLIDSACSLLAADHTLQELNQQLDSAGGSASLQAGVGGGVRAQCPEYLN
jgi:hypothetical protein